MNDSNPNTGPAFPIAIGGIGGSGTRVVAEILGRLGYYLGGDLNQEKDNLWYTLLFKRRSVIDSTPEHLEHLARIFCSVMSGRASSDPENLGTIERLALEQRHGHDVAWLAERSATLQAALPIGHETRAWAWKEPNTHILVDFLAKHITGLRYIHVIRDGLDMAFSPNRNQLHYWADSLFGMTDFDPDEPAAALRYWRLANERIVALRESNSLPILEVGFECLCERPADQILAIADFCDVDLSREMATDIGAETVSAPKTAGRHRDMDISGLDADDCRYARETKSRLFQGLKTRATAGHTGI